MSHYIRSDGALAHIYREERGTASTLPAPSHLLQPPPGATDPATELTGENLTVPEQHLHLHPPATGNFK